MSGRAVRLSAALPYALDEEGDPMVLLVCRMTTGLWSLPEGPVLRGEAPHVAAAREAYALAGLIGCVVEEPIGAFSRDDGFRNGCAARCLVEVFPFAVEAAAEEWPEAAETVSVWLAPAVAAGLVNEPGLAEVLGNCARWLATAPGPADVRSDVGQGRAVPCLETGMSGG